MPDITVPDMMTFVVLALQMGHELKDTLHDYWSRLRKQHNPFYGENMARDRFLHILRFLNFADNSQRPDEGKEYDRLWKLRAVSSYIVHTISSYLGSDFRSVLPDGHVFS